MGGQKKVCKQHKMNGKKEKEVSRGKNKKERSQERTKI
jgi:hypothetical protein